MSGVVPPFHMSIPSSLPELESGRGSANGAPSPAARPSDLVALLAELPRWYAIRTRSRHEKIVAKQLLSQHIETYLPVSNEIHRWSDRQKQVELPLFPGYAFVRLVYSPSERVRVLRTHGVAGFVGTQGQGIPVPDRQIEDIKTLLTQKVRFKPHSALEIGQRVRIRGGSLNGVEGILLAQKNERTLVISIEAIQRAISVDVEGYDLETI